MTWWIQVQNFFSSRWYAILNLAGLLVIVVVIFLVVAWAIQGKVRAD